MAAGFRESAASLSPDGRWLAYTSDATGRDEVYVAPYPGPGATVPVSTDGGAQPLWARGGRELYYRIGSQVMVVDVELGEELAAGAPRLLFEGAFLDLHHGGLSYDVTSDGERFVMIAPIGGMATRLRLVTNWNEEVRRRLERSR